MVPEGPVDPTPDRQAATPPSKRVEELEAEVERLEAELDERTQDLARVQSNYKGYKQRVQREKEQTRQEARAEIVEVLAGVLDDVDRALTADPSPDVRKGLELVVKRIDDQLASIDAERIGPEPGAAFDPNVHEALLTETREDREPDTVLELLQPGYRLEDRVVRAARVKVAKAPDE